MEICRQVVEETRKSPGVNSYIQASDPWGSSGLCAALREMHTEVRFLLLLLLLLNQGKQLNLSLLQKIVVRIKWATCKAT